MARYAELREAPFDRQMAAPIILNMVDDATATQFDDRLQRNETGEQNCDLRQPCGWRLLRTSTVVFIVDQKKSLAASPI